MTNAKTLNDSRDTKASLRGEAPKKHVISAKNVWSPDSDILRVKALFEQYVSKKELEAYRLPCDFDTEVIVGLSGGADSSILALFCAAYLAPLYPSIHYVFCDTKAEPSSAYETLDQIEEWTGIEIERIEPELGLFEQIEKNNGFMPNSRARWCTVDLKVKPTTEYMKQFKKAINLAGLRADESNREGLKLVYSMEKERETQSKSAFPFIDLGIKKEAVFEILKATIGIPSTYQYRSRSGCYNCFFQRNQEIVGMYFNHPEHFNKTAAYEKLSESDEGRWPMTKVLRDQGVRGYYPVPDFVNITKQSAFELPEPAKAKDKRDQSTHDLFGAEEKTVRIYAAFALYVHPMLGYFSGFSKGTYWQEFITFSTSRNGLSAALKTYWEFKQTTPYVMTNIEHLNIVMVAMDFPESALDIKHPGDESYTWKNKVAYKQIAHIVSSIQQLLEYIEAKQDLEDARNAEKRANNLDDFLDASEWVERAEWLESKLDASRGRLVWEGLYRPKQLDKDREQLVFELDEHQTKRSCAKPKEGIEFDDVPMACIACSI